MCGKDCSCRQTGICTDTRAGFRARRNARLGTATDLAAELETFPDNEFAFEAEAFEFDPPASEWESDEWEAEGESDEFEFELYGELPDEMEDETRRRRGRAVPRLRSRSRRRPRRRKPAVRGLSKWPFRFPRLVGGLGALIVGQPIAQQPPAPDKPSGDGGMASPTMPNDEPPYAADSDSEPPYAPEPVADEPATDEPASDNQPASSDGPQEELFKKGRAMNRQFTFPTEPFEFYAESEDEFDLGKKVSDSRIIDLTAQADKSRRLRTRDSKQVHALVLHQMACCYKVKDPLKRFLKIAPHFAILPDGRILQLHPILSLTGASNGFNHGSVAVEFAGNFPDVKGKWWIDRKELGVLKETLKKLPTAQIQARVQAYIKANQNQVTPQQIEAGRYLVRYLKQTMGLKTILAHRQSSKDRENDPGPDIWYHVGQWAIDNLGLKDGGPGFKVGTGNPIPDLWRKWGQAGPQPELEFSGYESGGNGELEFEGELSFGSPLRTPRKVNPKFVSCNPPSAAVKAITGADPVGTIQKANTRAIKLLDKAINQLQDTRKKIVGGAAASSPTISTTVSNGLKNRFKMNPGNRAIWTGQGSGTVDVLIRRLRGSRQILADGWMKYTCLGKPAPATVTVHRGGRSCTVEGCAGERAFTCGGNSHIVLCKPWWEEDLGVNKLDAQATTLLHECFHIYFGFIGDQEQGNHANAHCYAQFVLNLNGLPVPTDFVSSCP